MTYHKEFQPQVLTKEEQSEVMREVALAIKEATQNLNHTEGDSLAIAGMLLRYSIALYRGVLPTEEILDLLDYISNRITDVEPFYPEKRHLN